VNWVVLLAAALLAGVAAGGILRPFGSPGRMAVDPPPDPLEDERISLLRTLRQLEEDRARGELTDSTYLWLRSETESRAVTVLRAIEARDGAGELSAGLRELRPVSAEHAGRPARASNRRRLIPALVAVAVLGMTIPILVRAVADRRTGEPITGGAGNTATSLAALEGRVAEHPRDLAARLDLADRYMSEGNSAGAAANYLVALQIDPRNAEARAKLGFLLYQGGKAQEGLRAVETALAVDPAYPEALYYKGVILLRALGRPADAAEAFGAYLASAPFGSRRTEVEQLLREAERSG
jgi:tetratricopeptide (TPR) repeat protein